MKIRQEISIVVLNTERICGINSDNSGHMYNWRIVEEAKLSFNNIKRK